MISVILVNKKNKKIGICEKIEAHKKGLLHRAFSVFIYNKKGDLLLQKRAINKYHAGGLWSNTVCSHPFVGEKTINAAKRRLQEEMGFSTPIKKITEIIYTVKIDKTMTEHEHDSIFAGIWDGTPSPNPEEVDDYQWISEKKLSEEISIFPEKYTPWFLEIIKKINNKKIIHLYKKMIDL